MLVIKKIKKDFPIFQFLPDLVYLDSAATSLKPKSVIEKIEEYYQKYSANIHRGIYLISEWASKEYEETRRVVAEFINARPEEIVFTKNTTESLNTIAFGLADKFLKKGEEILITIMEHHSNFVPWQEVSKRKRVKLKILDIDNQGRLKISDLERLITKKTKIFSFTFVSNVLGTINPVKEMVQIAKSQNQKIIIVVDAAQAVPHRKIDVRDLGIDFLAFSGHKILGPTGTGILWGREELLNLIPPLNFGGGMIEEVGIKETKIQKAPFKFEAGTPSIANIIALKEAIFYLKKIGMENIENHSIKLSQFAFEILKKEFGAKIKIYGPEKERGSLISFNFKNYHPHDISQILDKENICVRAGHHCAMPLHKRLKTMATVRASFYIYNQEKDIEKLVSSLKKVEKILA